MPICDACGQEGASSKAPWYCWKQGHKHKCAKVEKPSAATAPAEAAVKEAAAAPHTAAAGAAAQDSGGGACTRHDDECAICLDALQQPQTMPCGHRFCRGCVAGMRQHGAAAAQVCPLCRGAMPDAERLQIEAHRLLTQHEQWKEGQPGGAPLLAASLGKATALCRETLAIDPADAHAQHALGYALVAGGDKAGAETAYRAAIAADPLHARAHCNLGVLLGERGDKAGAEAAYRTAIAADRQHADAHYNLGLVLAELGDLAGAARSFTAALQVDPSHAQAKADLQLAQRMAEEDKHTAVSILRMCVCVVQHRPIR